MVFDQCLQRVYGIIIPRYMLCPPRLPGFSYFQDTAFAAKFNKVVVNLTTYYFYFLKDFFLESGNKWI